MGAMGESWRTFLFRQAFNLWPCYRGTGGRVEHVAADWSEIRVSLPLSWRTRNYVGTIFGGSLYGAVDPFFMIMLMHRLGPAYLVWDKSASIRFRRPGRSRLRARFLLPPGEEAAIRAALAAASRVDRTYTVELVDQAGEVHAAVEKLVHVSLRAAPSGVGPPRAGADGG
jgi:acyl-coenzyme A thioesterase PaaI-like protein